ncbi:uncharacterized protein DUF3892 [Litoreibacter meonggei]|uniref:Uncharacterized protein DUF3892 n=1 Tax=Litoreibacter meonggei TaxID=1049199 RepID=A0A497VMF2_9RHOB|nr:DUF3892 domain-containing protein [Litoreibacter meonggei]RLJ41385.1 uncharacterized protein DUF3892 [Litoreibacter meonggei]
MANQIDCIEKQDRYDPSEAIVSVGGRNADGTRWSISQKEAIQRIKSRQNEFYVSKNGHRVNVLVATSRFGNEYIKTENDDHEPNNLLELQSCRVAA